MTFSEYIATLGTFVGQSLTTAQIAFILTEQDLDPAAVITTAADRVAVKTALYFQIPIILAGLQNVSEGGFSVSWNFDLLKAWYAALANELGLDDVLALKPRVQDLSNRW